MVYDIANSVGREAQVDLLASDSVGDAFVDNNVHFIRRKYRDIVLNIFHCVSPRILISLLRKYKMNKGTALRVIYYWLISGYYSKIIRDGNYDIVHMHSCNFCNEIWMKVCKRYNKKFLITLHALNSFSDTVKMEPAGKKYEQDFFRRVLAGNMPISVISSGMKRTIENIKEGQECNNIKVVCNAFKEATSDGGYLENNIRDKYKIPSEAFVILYAGNISINKNQQQLVEAFECLPEEIKVKTYVLFCGKDNTVNQSFSEFVKSNKNINHFKLCGQINREAMPAYFRAADGVVLLSLAEGFGLSLIEGMSFGKPALSFTDIDAFADVYSPRAMIGVESRDNERLAQGVVALIETDWDKDAIIEYSKRFNSKNMASNYLAVYTEL